MIQLAETPPSQHNKGATNRKLVGVLATSGAISSTKLPTCRCHLSCQHQLLGIHGCPPLRYACPCRQIQHIEAAVVESCSMAVLMSALLVSFCPQQLLLRCHLCCCLRTAGQSAGTHSCMSHSGSHMPVVSKDETRLAATTLELRTHLSWPACWVVAHWPGRQLPSSLPS